MEIEPTRVCSEQTQEEFMTEPKKLTVLSYEDLGLCKHRMNGNQSLVGPQVFCLSPARTDSRHNHGFSQIHLFSLLSTRQYGKPANSAQNHGSCGP